MDGRPTFLSVKKHFPNCHILRSSNPNSMEYIVIDIFFPTILQLVGNDNYGAVSTSIQFELTEPVSTLSVSMCLKLDCD